MALQTAQLYLALITFTLTTMFKNALRNLSNAYGGIFDRDNLTVVSAISLVLGVAATIAAFFLVSLPAWQYLVIAPATVVVGIAVITTAQLIAEMMVDAITGLRSIIRSVFSGIQTAGATA